MLLKKENILNSLAYTLAEVIIVIGIIGIIAELSIPTLVSDINKTILQNQLKKSYSTLQNALNQMQYDLSINNFLQEYPLDQDNREKFISDIKPYLRAEICTERTKDCGESGSLSGYSTLNKNKYYLFGAYSTSLLLSDGSVLRISSTSTNLLYMDINGYHKKPNRAGYDLFAFQLTSNGKIIPFNNVNRCNKLDTNYDNGDGCTAYALVDKSPEDDTKSYWKNFLD